jgi:hypothetical protein
MGGLCYGGVLGVQLMMHSLSVIVFLHISLGSEIRDLNGSLEPTVCLLILILPSLRSFLGGGIGLGRSGGCGGWSCLLLPFHIDRLLSIIFASISYLLCPSLIAFSSRFGLLLRDELELRFLCIVKACHAIIRGKALPLRIALADVLS